MMGGEGLTRATEVAILNANYIATGSIRIFRCCISGAGRHGRA
jgi:glycine cleavage system protein P-like pyridoxal-binding family